MYRLGWFALIMAIVMGSGSLHAQSVSGDAPSATGLNAGDQLRIAVWRNPELSGDFVVAPNGTIVHPLYREVQVTGIPLSTVEERLRTFLTRYITNPQFVISPLVKIIVGGEVRAPNIYSVPPETTIAQTLALAGGPTDRADLRKLRILRDAQLIVVDLNNANSDVARLQIRSNDQILMPRKRASAYQVIGPVFSFLAAAGAIANLVSR